MKPWIELFFVGITLTSVPIAQAVLTQEASLLTIPQFSATPNLDGNVETREWTEAALLPPIGRLPNGASDGHDARLFLGWLGDNLFIGVKSSRSLQASAGKSNAEDHLDLTLNFPSGGKRVIKVGPAQGSLTPGKTMEGWVCKTQSSETGWQAEIQVPFAAIGARGDWKLEAVLHEPSIGRTSPTLAQHLSFTDRRIACRFSEAGEFSNGKYQGAELEIINADTADAQAELTLILKSDGMEISRAEEKQITLRGDSNHRFRVVTPWKAGAYSVDYEMQIGGVTMAKGALTFEASGPIRVSLVPFFLWRDGVFVRTEILNAKPAAVTLMLLDSTARKTLRETTFRTADDGKGEGFVSTQGVKPGAYLIRVRARQEGETVALQTVALHQ